MIRRGLAGVACALVAIAVTAGQVAAHGADGGAHTLLGPATFVLGVIVVGLAVGADARDAVTPKVADLGVGVGVVLVVGGLAVYYVV